MKQYFLFIYIYMFVIIQCVFIEYIYRYFVAQKVHLCVLNIIYFYEIIQFLFYYLLGVHFLDFILKISFKWKLLNVHQILKKKITYCLII